jgi:hypothetical protein
MLLVTPSFYQKDKNLTKNSFFFNNLNFGAYKNILEQLALAQKS